MSSSTNNHPAASTTKPLKELNNYGQSVWLDYMRRHLMSSGEMRNLVEDYGLGGVTSTPAIFVKSITGSTYYTDALFELQLDKSLDAMAIYEHLAIKDIQDAADVLRPAYDRTKRRDGYVSLEVSPFLAKDTQGTIKDARRLWKAVNRPNLMVKIPATVEGLPAIEQMLSEGININITLLFAQDRYEQVARAYIAGLQKWASSGGEVGRVASVASFFISRIDSMVDAMIKPRLQASTDEQERTRLKSLLGKSRHRQCAAYIPALQEHLLGPRVGQVSQAGGADTKGAVGFHQHQGPQLLRRALRGRADRSGHGEYDSAGDPRRFPRSWQAPGQPGIGPRRGASRNGAR